MTIIEPIKRTAHEKLLLWKAERRRRQWIKHYDRLRKDAFKGLETKGNADLTITYLEDAS